jgi:DNA-binding MarR family transcriptional regulator
MIIQKKGNNINNINKKLPSTSNKKELFDSLSVIDLWVLLDTVHYTIARSQILELIRSGITREQARTLHVLNLYNGSTTLKNISEVTKRQPNSVSTLVNRMEKAGLVVKIKNPEDKVYRITITKKAQARYDKATYRSLELIFSSLSPKQQQQFAHNLEIIRQKANNVLDLMLG